MTQRPIWYDERTVSGRRTVLSPLSAKTRRCLTAAEQMLRATLAQLEPATIEPPTGLWYEPELQDDGSEFDDELYNHLPVWQVLTDDCREDGSCCERTELGLVLGGASDGDLAATAHLAALAQMGSELSRAAEALLTPGFDDACQSSSWRHCRALQLAVEELATQLTVAAAAFNLSIQVERK